MNSETEQWINDIGVYSKRERFIEQVARSLEERKMSKAEFARHCRCSPSNIYHILNGYVAYVPKYVWRTAKQLGLFKSEPQP